MTNCFCCASNVFKQPDYYNNLWTFICTAVKFTLKLRKELKILRCLSCTCFVSRGSDIYFHYLESLDQLLIWRILLKTLFTVQCSSYNSYKTIAPASWSWWSVTCMTIPASISLSIQKYLKKLNYFFLEAGDEFKCQKRQFYGTFNLYNHVAVAFSRAARVQQNW